MAQGPISNGQNPAWQEFVSVRISFRWSTLLLEIRALLLRNETQLQEMDFCRDMKMAQWLCLRASWWFTVPMSAEFNCLVLKFCQLCVYATTHLWGHWLSLWLNACSATRDVETCLSEGPQESIGFPYHHLHLSKQLGSAAGITWMVAIYCQSPTGSLWKGTLSPPFLLRQDNTLPKMTYHSV